MGGRRGRCSKIRTSTKLECRRLGERIKENAIRVLLDLQGNVQYIRAIQGHSGPQELDLTYFTLKKIPYMWIFLVHAGARRTIADEVSKEAFMQEEPATDGEGTLATSRPRTSWKSHCQISQRLPTTSPRWSIIHTGRKAYFENRATSRFVILSNMQQRDRPRKYDAIICLGEKMTMKEHWETEMLFDMKNTTNEDSQEKVSIQHQKCISADTDTLHTTKKTKAV